MVSEFMMEYETLYMKLKILNNKLTYFLLNHIIFEQSNNLFLNYALYLIILRLHQNYLLTQYNSIYFQ